jgi:hypothetical protein
MSKRKTKNSPLYEVVNSTLWKHSSLQADKCEEVSALMVWLLTRSEGETHEDYMARLGKYGIPEPV